MSSWYVILADDTPYCVEHPLDGTEEEVRAWCATHYPNHSIEEMHPMDKHELEG